MRYFLVIGLLSMALAGKAQNYTLSAFDTVYYGNPGDLFLPSVTVTNVSSDSIHMMARRIVRNVPPGWNSCFCYPFCVAQTQDTLLFWIPPPGGKNTNSQLVAPNFGTDSIPGIGVVVVVISEIGGASADTVTYRGITTGVVAISQATAELPVLFPNPATDRLTISIVGAQVGQVDVLDAYGKGISGIPCSFSSEELVIDISSLPAGTYTVALHNKGKICSRRIIKP